MCNETDCVAGMGKLSCSEQFIFHKSLLLAPRYLPKCLGKKRFWALQRCWAWTIILAELVFISSIAKLDSCASPLFLASLLFSLFLFSSTSLLRIGFLAVAMYTTVCCYAPAPLEVVFEQIGENLVQGSVLIFGLSDGYRETVKLWN